MSKIKIQGNASGTGVLTVEAPNTNTDRTITLPDSTGTLVDDTTAVTKDASGNVGIGTSSPNNPVHINGGAADTALQITNNATGTAATDGFSITVENPTASVAIRNREATDMKFLTSNTERMRIDSAGIVTMPSQPSFRAGRNAGNVAPGNNVVFNVAYHNIGVHYSSSNGKFTAPVAGSYQFNVRLINTNGAYNTDLARITLNGGSGVVVNMHSVASTSHAGNSLSVVIYLNANDFINVLAANHDVYGTIAQHCSFSGHLIG